jgi:hypothetical protein
MWILEVIKNLLQQMNVHSNVDEIMMGSMGRFYNVGSCLLVRLVLWSTYCNID